MYSLERSTVNKMYLGIARIIAAAIIGTITGSVIWGLVELLINL